jgi:hypothetical protein
MNGKPDLWLTIAAVAYVGNWVGWTAYFIVKIWGGAA